MTKHDSTAASRGQDRRDQFESLPRAESHQAWSVAFGYWVYGCTSLNIKRFSFVCHTRTYLCALKSIYMIKHVAVAARAPRS